MKINKPPPAIPPSAPTLGSVLSYNTRLFDAIASSCTCAPFIFLSVSRAPPPYAPLPATLHSTVAFYRYSCQALIGCQDLIGPFGQRRSWQQSAKRLTAKQEEWASAQRDRNRSHHTHAHLHTQPHRGPFEKKIKVL